MKVRGFLLLVLLGSAVQAMADVPYYRYLEALPGMCPRPVKCSPDLHFVTLAAADHCGCCKCHGGTLGCSGGANGIVMCVDGTRSPYCNCQYTMRR